MTDDEVLAAAAAQQIKDELVKLLQKLQSVREQNIELLKDLIATKPENRGLYEQMFYLSNELSKHNLEHMYREAGSL